MKSKSSIEAIRHLKREERKLNIKALLAKDPEKREAILDDAKRIRERRNKIAALSGKCEKATIEK